MDDFSPSDLKTILHSKRANLYYLQHCRVLVNGGRVEYVTDEGSKSRYWNIPIANTTSLLLGTGTSITQAAMRELAKAGVLVGFCGGGGTPLFAANEVASVSPLFHRWCCNCLNSVENFSAINEIGGFPAGIMLLPLTP